MARSSCRWHSTSGERSYEVTSLATSEVKRSYEVTSLATSEVKRSY